MTPLPAPLGGTSLVAWRLDQKTYAASWDSGEGARLYGGRWNSRGRRIVYCSIDPATAILEVAVHTGFKALDTVPHGLTFALIASPEAVQVLQPNVVPNASKVWKLPQSTEGRPHALKYRLYCGKLGKTIVRYDNETGKGNHRHVGPQEVESVYVFVIEKRVDGLFAPYDDISIHKTLRKAA